MKSHSRPLLSDQELMILLSSCVPGCGFCRCILQPFLLWNIGTFQDFSRTIDCKPPLFLGPTNLSRGVSTSLRLAQGMAQSSLLMHVPIISSLTLPATQTGEYLSSRVLVMGMDTFLLIHHSPCCVWDLLSTSWLLFCSPNSLISDSQLEVILVLRGHLACLEIFGCHSWGALSGDATGT